MAKVPKAVKDSVWKKYMGKKTEGQCYCCKIETITVFNFEVGHNKARSKGGGNTIDNLRPICKTCNTSMGTQSIESFRAKHFSIGGSNYSARSNLSANKLVRKKLASKEYLNNLTVKQLKYLAKKHGITPSATVKRDLLWGTKTVTTSKRQYVNSLFGEVYEGEKLSE